MRLENQIGAKLCKGLKSVVKSLDFILNALKGLKQGSNMIWWYSKITLTPSCVNGGLEK